MILQNGTSESPPGWKREDMFAVAWMLVPAEEDEQALEQLADKAPEEVYSSKCAPLL